MPSRSSAQHRLMEAAEHNPEVARRTGISRDVAHEFTEADRKNKNWRKKDHVAQKADFSPEIARLLNKA